MWRLVLIAALLLAACQPTDAVPGTPVRGTAVPWQASAAPIALDNVARLAPLGRLDQPETANTIMTSAVSPDGTRLATLTFTNLFMYDLLGGGLDYSGGRGEATQLYFSPDKTELYAIAPDGSVTVYDAVTGGVLNTFAGHPAYSGSAAFDSLDGRLALGGSDGTVKVWDAFERTSLATLTAAGSSVIAVALSPDGDRVASGSFDRRVRVWDWTTGAAVADWDTDGADITRLAFDPAGDQVAAGLSSGVRLWSLSSGEQTADLPLDAGGAQRVLQFSPDGRYLVGGSQTAGVFVWALAADGPTLLSRLPDVTGDNITAQFSPDSNMLITASVGRPVTLWNLTQITGDSIGRADLPVASDTIIDVDWTDDGRLLLFFDALGTVYVWGIPEG